MQTDKADLFISLHSDDFPSDAIPAIRAALINSPDEAFTMANMLNYRKPVIALILSIFLGSFGIDRFYAGDILAGVLKLLTCGGAGIWTIVDWFLIMPSVRRSNYYKLMNCLNISQYGR